MRTKQSMKNISISITSQFIICILGFISRKVFIHSLGANYLGVNGLLTNVISMLALAESGIGTSIVYNLYKPLAEGNKEKIIALVQLYKKAYTVLALVFFGLSIMLYPFLENLMKDGRTVKHVTVVYFIFIFKNMISYLNAHKWSLISADQKGYVLQKVNLIFQVLTTIIKIIVLVLTKNYIIYLLIELGVFSLQNIVNGMIVNKRYSYIRVKEKHSIDKSTKDSIIQNIKALVLHNIGGYCVFGTDNILISSFIGIATVGLYSNYTMIIDQLAAFIRPLLLGIGASVGNLIATESNDKSYSIFKVMYLVNFWVYSFGVIFLYNLLESFINWWLGYGYLLDNSVFIIILMNFYLVGIRISIATFKAKAGLFVQDKYASILEAVINLVSSVVLIKYFGLVGIFIGTTISTLAITSWNQPRIVYKYVFNVPVRAYFIRYISYAVLTITTCFVTTAVCKLIIDGNSFLSLVEKGIICLIVPNIIYIAIFYKTQEFQYLLNVMRINLSEIRLRYRRLNY
jgi:O-antigen/teichoic acid export membrane protein